MWRRSHARPTSLWQETVYMWKSKELWVVLSVAYKAVARINRTRTWKQPPPHSALGLYRLDPLRSTLWSERPFRLTQPDELNRVGSCCLFIGVFGTELQGTSPTAACLSPKFPAANIFVRPAVANWIFSGFVAVLLAFSVAGPTVWKLWNSLPDSLRDPAVESEPGSLF